MKPLYLTVLVLCCTSCMTYQYATVSSSIEKEDSNALVVETDTLKIMYAFNGEQGPVKISIFNKLNSPLYLDWSKSALIVGDIRRSYWANQSTLEGNVNSTDTRLSRTYSQQDASFNGIITSRESMAFIPPHSWANEYQINLSPSSINPATPGARYNTEKVNGINVKTYQYNEGNSPLRFRSFLTLSLKQDMSTPIYLDHSFWVSEIAETEITPDNFPNQNDQFYIKKPMQ